MDGAQVKESITRFATVD